MGYEVLYRYHEKNEDGEYNRDELFEKSIQVGEPCEDIELDDVAGKVMTLMARRSIFVIDVEIFEYSKKKVSYRETKNAIYIKNRKFQFDDPTCIKSVIVEDVVEEEKTPQEKLLQLLQNNPDLIKTIQAQTGVKSKLPVKAIKATNVNANSMTAPIRREICDPDLPGLLESAINQGIALTKGKKYSIYAEKPNPVGVQAGMIYTIKDDNGSKKLAPSTLFVPERTMLVGNFDPDGKVNDSGLVDGKLLGGFINDDVPKLR